MNRNKILNHMKHKRPMIQIDWMRPKSVCWNITLFEWLKRDLVFLNRDSDTCLRITIQRIKIMFRPFIKHNVPTNLFWLWISHLLCFKCFEILFLDWFADWLYYLLMTPRSVHIVLLTNKRRQLHPSTQTLGRFIIRLLIGGHKNKVYAFHWKMWRHYS